MAQNPFRYFKTSPEIIQLGVLMYVRFPLSLRNVEDRLHERGIDICHETIRHWVLLGSVRGLIPQLQLNSNRKMTLAAVEEMKIAHREFCEAYIPPARRK